MTKSERRLRFDKIKPFILKNVIVVIEEPNDLNNIGAIIRNANLFGIPTVYIVDTHHKVDKDWTNLRKNKKLLATSASSVKWTYVKVFGNTFQCINHLQKHKYKSIVTSPHIKGHYNYSIHDINFSNYKKLAIWFGNEKRGVSDEITTHSIGCINIPTFGIIESLNLGTSSGIILCELVKQRRKSSSNYTTTISNQ